MRAASRSMTPRSAPTASARSTYKDENLVYYCVYVPPSLEENQNPCSSSPPCLYRSTHLVHNQQIPPCNSGPTFARHFVPSRHIDHVDNEVG